jgi:serine/threonine protein kinase
MSFVTSERARRFMMSLPDTPPAVFAELFPVFRDEVDMLDLLERMLDFHPDTRISIEKALEHPFLASLHNADDEPTAEFTFSFDFENESLPRERVQELIWRELRGYHPNIASVPPPFTLRKRTSKSIVGNGQSGGTAPAQASGGPGEQTVAGIAAAAHAGRGDGAKDTSDDGHEEAKHLSRKRSISPHTTGSDPERRAGHK